MKLKHNKKRNTAFLYEVLVRHLTKSVIDQDLKKKEKILVMIKEHFYKGSQLSKELEVYNAITTNTRLDYHLAEKLLFEAKRSYSKIDKEKLFKEQSELIKKINKLLSKEAYSIFVPSYKNLASIQQIFNEKASLKSRMILEEKVVRGLASSNPRAENTLSSIDNIVYKTFVKNFNKEYSSHLLEEQKTLLNKYISSFSDNGLEFKLHLNEEVGRLKEEVGQLLKKDDVVLQEDISNKIKEVLIILNEFKDQDITQEMVERILKIQSLVKEI